MALADREAPLLERRIHDAVVPPVERFVQGGGKAIRAQLLRLGAEWTCGREPARKLDANFEQRLARASALVECLHAGSLIIDDIQDQSTMRRGEPSLYRRLGVPRALNAGNWLYAWSLDQVATLELSPESELELHRLFHRTLLKGHYGQGFDLATPMDEVAQAEVRALCLASMELKTGALTAFAAGVGGILAGLRAGELAPLLDFGLRFGIALQMFDDIGNFTAAPPKRKEDLRLRRPGWLWAVASEQVGAADYGRFVEAVRHLPDESFLHPWAELHELIPQARARATGFLGETLDQFAAGSSPQNPGCAIAREIAKKLETSYA